MKQDIKTELSQCNRRQIVNRKARGKSKYITTTRPLELVAVDLIDFKKMGVYLMISIDYFSRYVCGFILTEKTSSKIIEGFRSWFHDGNIPEVLIHDNGKEFCNAEVKGLLEEFGIENKTLCVEDHQRNGRIERVIRTMREGIYKTKGENFNDVIDKVLSSYNNTYHSAIRCTPQQALSCFEKYKVLENNMYNPRNKKKKMIGRGKYNLNKDRKSHQFRVNDRVRISQNENISKEMRGRFLRTGVIQGILGEESYLIKYDDSGKYARKREHCLKKS